MKTCKKKLHQYDPSLRQCLECKIAYQLANKHKYKSRIKKYYADNRDRIVEISNKWKSENKPRLRELQLLRHYGINNETFNKMFNDQNGQCAICKRHQSELPKTLSVDHDHNTGKVRGLLCDRCNRAIGFMKDDPNLLVSAAEYIKGHSDESIQIGVQSS